MRRIEFYECCWLAWDGPCLYARGEGGYARLLPELERLGYGHRGRSYDPRQALFLEPGQEVPLFAQVPFAWAPEGMEAWGRFLLARRRAFEGFDQCLYRPGPGWTALPTMGPFTFVADGLLAAPHRGGLTRLDAASGREQEAQLLVETGGGVRPVGAAGRPIVLILREPDGPALALLDGGVLTTLRFTGSEAVLSPTRVRRPIRDLTGCQAAGGRVLFGHSSGRAVVVDRHTGGALADIPDAAQAVLSPDGRYLGTLGYQRVRVWGDTPLRLVGEFPLPGALPRSLAFSPDGLTLAVATGYGAVLLDLDLG
jgi:hypothetical protein